MEKLELKHLAPYLPHGLKGIEYIGGDLHTLCRLNVDNRAIWTNDIKRTRDRIDCKPILRPLSEKTLREIFKNFSRLEINIKKHSIKIKYNLLGDIFETWIKTSGNFSNCPKWIIDLFNENHVDYNGLIEKGLAVSIHDIKTK